MLRAFQVCKPSQKFPQRFLEECSEGEEGRLGSFVSLGELGNGSIRFIGCIGFIR